ncbi:MAG: hypothetical protein F6K19_18800 [Cyanothece sp. SIO1E1]|nr:hypothetical protein [Cyanothece sp. SIO1E1]
MVTLQLRQIDVPVGQRLLIHHLDWQQFERILAELGETRSSRIAYIYILQSGQYQSVSSSPTFPTLPILELVKAVLEQSIEIGRSSALRALRKKIRSII